MTHGDDDGLRLPPAIAPRQIVVVPMLRGKPEDADVLGYCEALVRALGEQTALGSRIRAFLDTKDIKSADKRWNWVRRGAPIIVEIGPRDMTGGMVTFMRRDQLRDGDKVRSHALAREAFVAKAAELLTDIQVRLFAEAKTRLTSNIHSGMKNFAELAEYFGQAGEEDEGGEFKGWVRASWSNPSGTALEKIEHQLKQLKLSIRNAPREQPSAHGPCLFTGEKGLQEILIARSY